MSLIIFLIVLSVLVIVHEFGHFIAAKRAGVRVEIFSFGFGPKIASIKRGETEYMICAIPLGGYVKMAGDEPGGQVRGENWEFLSKKISERFAIIFAGPVANYIFAFMLLIVVFMVGTPVTTTEIGLIIDGYPAKQAGLMVGDKILAIDGKKISYGETLVDAINRRVKGSMVLTVERGGKIFNKEITPVVEKRKIAFMNKEVELARIGIQPAQKIIKSDYGFFGSVYMAAMTIWRITAISYMALWEIIVGKLSVSQLTGPIGIFVMTSQVAKLGFIYLLNFMVIISTSLAIFNLLPFPILDGGHILFLLIEKIRGKPLSLKTQEIISNAGVIFLILLTVYIFYSDIMRFGIFENIFKFFRK